MLSLGGFSAIPFLSFLVYLLAFMLGLQSGSHGACCGLFGRGFVVVAMLNLFNYCLFYTLSVACLNHFVYFCV